LLMLYLLPLHLHLPLPLQPTLCPRRWTRFWVSPRAARLWPIRTLSRQRA